jgi:hypothetical protein
MGEIDPQDESPFERTLASLRKIVQKTVDHDITFYDDHVGRVRLAAMGVTSITILLAALLPFLAAADFPNKTFWVGGVSVAVAALTGLAAYWRWTDEWRGYILASMTLKSLRGAWELALIEASLKPEAEGQQLAVRATRRLLEQAGEAARRETAERFESLLLTNEEGSPGTP